MNKEKEIQSLPLEDDLDVEIKEFLLSHKTLLGGTLLVSMLSAGALVVVHLLRKRRKNLSQELKPLAEELETMIIEGSEDNLLAIPLIDEVGGVIATSEDQQESIDLLRRISKKYGFPSGSLIRNKVLIAKHEVLIASAAVTRALELLFHSDDQED